MYNESTSVLDYMPPLLLLIFRFIALISPLTDNKPRSILDLHIYLPDVFPDNPEAHKLYSAHEAYDTYCTCPAGYCVAEQVVNDSPYNTDEAEN